MVYLGGLDGDERMQLTSIIGHFVTKLNEERAKTHDLTRQLEAMKERVSLLELQAYGSSFL